MNSLTLPVDWQLVSLREFRSNSISAINPQRFPTETFEYFSIPAYQEGRMPVRTLGRQILSQKLLLPDHCVLFGKLNPRVEKVWFVSGRPESRRLGSTEWLSVVPDNKTDQRYLYFVLRSQWVMPRARDLVSGSTPSRERVDPRSFYAIEVPRPPLQEQKEISAILSFVEQNLAKQEELIRLAAMLKQEAMRKLFTQGLRGEEQKDSEIGLIPESWNVVQLGSLGRIGNGTTPNRRNAAYWQGGTVPWITSGRMYERRITGSDTCVTSTALEECSLPLLQPGAVLIAIVGQGKTLGHCAILDVEATISRHVGFIQPRDGTIVSEYLVGYLESRYEYLRQLAAGNGSTRGALTGAILKNLDVPLPTLDEQREIAGILDALDRKIALHKQKRKVLEELFQSMLNKLLTGEIRVCDLDMSALSAEVTV